MQGSHGAQAALKAEGIPSMVYYPKPMHLQTAFAKTPDQVEGDAKTVIPGLNSSVIPGVSSSVIPGSTRNLCPVATSLCDRVLSLPMHPYLTTDQIDIVCNAIRKALQ